MQEELPERSLENYMQLVSLVNTSLLITKLRDLHTAFLNDIVGADLGTTTFFDLGKSLDNIVIELAMYPDNNTEELLGSIEYVRRELYDRASIEIVIADQMVAVAKVLADGARQNKQHLKHRLKDHMKNDCLYS
jgi:hypothetical protein